MRPSILRLSAVALLASGALSAQDAPVVIERPSGRGVGKPIPPGSVLAPLLAEAKLLVVAFTQADCPLSKLYRPKLDRLDREWRPRKVAFLVAASDDPGVAALLRPERTTEVFVLDARGVLRYRGAVDDQYGIGWRREAPTRNFLTDALEALLEGREPAVRATEAPGCPVESAGAPATAAAAAKVAFHRDVAPLLQKRCAECHRPGEIGPFPLLTYEHARKSARRIKEAVSARRMPPWHADPAHGQWENDRRLSDAELRTIVAWVDAGTPEGDPKDAPPPRKFTEGWAIGKPDAVYRVPVPVRIPAEGTIPYKYVNVPTGLKEDRWIQAMEVRAGAREVVHHILVFVQYPPQRAREQTPHDGGLHQGYFATLVPGDRPNVFPEGMGKLLPAGSTLVFQIHYTATGKAVEDQSQIGIVWAKKPVKQEVLTRGIVNLGIRIPAGASSHREEAWFSFDTDARLVGFLPHLHLRGKAFRYVALAPDGKEQVLLDVPGYDFNWQPCYRPKEPIVVRKGTRIRATAVYDNSKANPANPDPTREVRFGEQTWDEMLIGYIDFVRLGAP